MTVLKVFKYPDPVLSKVATPVGKITADTVRLMDDMTETMYAEKGVGLAAPQVGVSKRVIVIDIGGDAGRLIQMANPEIISSEGEIEWEEGCLSVPEFRIKILRKARIAVRGLNRSGKVIEILADNLLSVAFQHEIDHINGVLLVDRVSKVERKKYLNRGGRFPSGSVPSHSI